MIADWILRQIEPLKREALVIVRDPQRMVQQGNYILDGWAEDNGFTVLLCQRNLYLREVYERQMRDDSDSRLLLVDRSREDAKAPLFYPDLDVLAGHKRQLRLSLRDYLIEATGDPAWPRLVDETNIARLLLANLDAIEEVHRQLRKVDSSRFTDSDLYRVVLGAALKINPFLKKLSPSQIRQLCIEQHSQIEQIAPLLPETIMETLRKTISSAPKPFCWLLERDSALIVRAFTLAAIMRQHGLEYSVLLTNLDPTLHDFREIDAKFLDEALRDQLSTDPDRVSDDIHDAENFLTEDKSRLEFLLRDRLKLGERDSALAVLQNERLSLLIRSLSLVSLLCDLITDADLMFHKQVIALLDKQTGDADLLAMRRPSSTWEAVESAYRRAFTVYKLVNRLLKYEKELKVKPEADLTFEEFNRLWNEEQLNRLDYYIADLKRKLRVGEISLLRPAFWKELDDAVQNAQQVFTATAIDIGRIQGLIDARFQDFYHLHYGTLIHQQDAPMIFTHQFLPRLLKNHWDPKSGQKAIIIVFDGMRTDAWDELLRPIFLERFDLVFEFPGSAIIPTETQLSRKAISAGVLPEAFTTGNELKLLQHWLRQNMGLQPKFEVLKDEGQIKSGISVYFQSDKLDYIVFNFTDKNLHEADDLARFYNTTVRDLIREDVRSVIHNLPENALVFITSDHGFSPVPETPINIPETVIHDGNDVKYRNARTTGRLQAPDAEKTVAFDVRQLGIPTTSEAVRNQPIKYVLFPRPGYSFRRPKWGHKPDPYTHGGISLAECFVPMVVMGPRQKVKPLLIIQSLRQVGAISEGEELSLEILVASSQLMPLDIAITFTFSHDDIPTRIETFDGKNTNTYTVRWKPALDNISDESRQQGYAQQAITVVMSYRQENATIRVSKNTEVRIKLDPAKLHRRVDSKLDLLMGKIPKGLQS